MELALNLKWDCDGLCVEQLNALVEAVSAAARAHIPDVQITPVIKCLPSSSPIFPIDSFVEEEDLPPLVSTGPETKSDAQPATVSENLAAGRTTTAPYYPQRQSRGNEPSSAISTIAQDCGAAPEPTEAWARFCSAPTSNGGTCRNGYPNRCQWMAHKLWNDGTGVRCRQHVTKLYAFCKPEQRGKLGCSPAPATQVQRF
jgi:hypothetical protein